MGTARLELPFDVFIEVFHLPLDTEIVGIEIDWTIADRPSLKLLVRNLYILTDEVSPTYKHHFDEDGNLTEITFEHW